MINFSGNPAATVILTYSPTNASPEDEVQQYYDNLCRAVESVPAHNVLIITGDFNARLGKNMSTSHFMKKPIGMENI